MEAISVGVSAMGNGSAGAPIARRDRTDAVTSGAGLGSNQCHARRNRSRECGLKIVAQGGTKDIGILHKFVGGLGERLHTSIVDLAYKPAGPHPIFSQGNFAPVPEIGERTKVEVIEGSIPLDFPAGIFIQVGPNPQFGAHSTISPFGRSTYHWFEGDGMLHATYFEEGGRGASYKNKYIETSGYKLEKEKGKHIFLPTVEVEGAAKLVNPLLNQVLLGSPNKCTSNTAVVHHAGRVFACSEVNLPTEFCLDDLSTVGPYNFQGTWKGAMTAHPKIDPDTKEMVTFAHSMDKPHLLFGIVSANGKIVRKLDAGLKRCAFVHDIAITSNFIIVPDLPFTFDMERVKKGGSLISFELDSYARVGILSRSGGNPIRWFHVDNGYHFHVLNAFEEGDEVVVHICRTRHQMIETPGDPEEAQEWATRILTPTNPKDVKASALDGACVACLYEWRLNMKSGGTTEKTMTDYNLSVEFPRMNPKFVGKPYKYGYSVVLSPMPLDGIKHRFSMRFDRFVKYFMKENDEQNPSYIKTEMHIMGPKRYTNEATFVPRPGATDEDEGWLISYVHDEISDISEVYVIDAQRMTSPPVTRLRVPQRVPYGFHSVFIPTLT